MNIQIRIAGVVISIQTKYRSIQETFSEYLVSNQQPNFSIIPTKATIDYEWRLDSLYDGSDDSFMKEGIEPLLERSAIYRIMADKLLSFHVMMMHGVVVSDGTYSYMFTAPSGVGKTTRGNLFVEHFPDSFVLNGDKPLIRVEKDRVVACGSPWKGKEGYGVNAEAPLKAIFLMERAEQINITELTLTQAFDYLLRQIYIPLNSENTLKTIQLLKSMNGKVRFFRFCSPPTTEAVEAAYWAANATK